MDPGNKEKAERKKKKEKTVSCKKIAQFSCPNFVPQDVTLQKWDVENPKHKLPDDFFCIIVGSRRIGKSVFAKYILYHYRKIFDLALVCTETPQNGYWQPIVGNQFVHEGMNGFLLEHLFDKQKQARDEEIQSNGRKKADHVLVILDDVIADRAKIHEDPQLNRLAVQGRHLYISVILTTQYPKAINTMLRENADLAVIFQQKTQRAKDAVFEDFLTKLGKKQEVIPILSKYTVEHDCVVVENWKLKQNATDVIFWLPGSVTWDSSKDKCTVPDYQLGSQEQQLLAKTKKGSVPIFSQ